MSPGPPDFLRVPNSRLRVSPDVQNLPPITRSRDKGGGPYYYITLVVHIWPVPTTF